MGAAAFDPIGAATVDIQSISPAVGTTEELYTGGVMLMTMTDGGETGDTYIYYTASDAPDGQGAGWFDTVGVRAVKTFYPGEGFVTVSDYETGALQSSGQVPNEATIFTLGTGVNSCGNTTPVSVGIANIAVGVGVDSEGNLLAVNPTTSEELYTGGVMIMTLTDGGETDETYIYYVAADAPDGLGAGWFDTLGARVSISFEAGEGFIAVSDYTEGCISIPAAL